MLSVVDLPTLDNCYLRYGLETGLLGLGMFLLFLGGVWAMIRKTERDAEGLVPRGLLFALKSSFLLGLILMFVVSMLATHVYLYVVVGLIAVLREESITRVEAGTERLTS